MEEIIDIIRPCSSVISGEGGYTQSNIVEEGPRICPICSSEIKFFFINFSEKVLMCENTRCDFPFGYEELQYTRVDNANDMTTGRTMSSQSKTLHTRSVISSTSWSEIERANRLYETEDIQLESRLPYDITQRSYTKDKKRKKSDMKLLKNVADIKGLNIELQQMDEQSRTLKNKKWIKNIMSLQNHSGVTLLKPEELQQLKADKAELKINIDKSENSISSIKIQIGDQ